MVVVIYLANLVPMLMSRTQEVKKTSLEDLLEDGDVSFGVVKNMATHSMLKVNDKCQNNQRLRDNEN